ncbi:hypothetical protein [Ulvibacterium marinum]|uniref:Uncharacterized protein n=1 Tax=Ulvibacterium marinum TaxID=2419782 RepID=A0A3B0C9W7_9FLAO|nr:hypothetical protein [Ulvibacterium marinum]RKN83235.1 hypothetical protein D7Z94_05225 [Ulvibacterium marinum]
MNRFIKVLRIIGQVLVLSSITLLAYPLIELKIPGKRIFTDQGQIGMSVFGALFFIIASGLLLNSIIMFTQNHWRNYRLIASIIIVILVFLVILPRENYVKSVLGKPKLSFNRINKNEKYATATIKIRLFNNGRFLSETYDAHLNNENMGNYTFENGNLSLDFHNEKPEYMGTELKIINDTLSCLNCTEKVKLI